MDAIGKIRRMFVPISEVKGYEPKWNFLFRKDRFDMLLNEKFGSKQLVVMCDCEVQADGSAKVVKPLYDFIVEEDGPINEETGLAQSNAVMGYVVRREDGYYVLVQSETRPVIRNDHTGQWGQTGNPVVIEHTIPGGFADPSDKNSLQTALRELNEETGISFDPTKVLRHELVGCFSSNRAYIATCLDVWLVLVSEVPKANESMVAKEEGEQIGKHHFVRIDKINPKEDGVSCAALQKIASALGCIKNF